MATQVIKNGITWEFDGDYTVGQFCNGDWYVVAPSGMTINSVSPAPLGGVNGSQLNPTVGGDQGLSANAGAYSSLLAASFPLTVSSGDALLSSIDIGSETVNWSGATLDSSAEIKSLEVLTVVSSVPAVGAFRPSYLDRSQTMYLESDIDASILPSLAMTTTPPDHSGFGVVEYFERGFERPWISFVPEWMGRTCHPSDNQLGYHRELGVFISEAMTLMMSNASGMEDFIRNFCQAGIDMFWMTTQGVGDSSFWVAPVLLTGLLLEDTNMQRIVLDSTSLSTSRDFEKFYLYADRKSTSTSATVPVGETWTGATAFFRKELDDEYEHLDPPVVGSGGEWPATATTDETYRSCCDSWPHVGMVLAGFIMRMQGIWGHQATFDYIDRWMTEPDSVYTDKSMTPLNYMRDGGTTFINEMWTSYRSSYISTEVSKDNIKWNLGEELSVGQFITGDWYVVAPSGVTVNSITMLSGEVYSGSMKNPTPSNEQGYASGADAYNASLNESFPLDLVAGDNLVSATSHVYDSGAQTWVNEAAILTVLSTAPASGSFRPGYCDTSRVIHNESAINYDNLGSKTATASVPSLATVAGMFARPWIDHLANWQGRGIHPFNNMRDYGLEISTDIGIGALALNCNYTPAQKRTALIGFLQLGIDLYSISQRATNTWINNGGHASGRKFPIMFTGKVLGYQAMLDVAAKSGDYIQTGGFTAPPSDYIHFGEDDQTFYVAQADVTLTNGGTWNPDVRNPNANQVYSSGLIGMPEWGIVHAGNPEQSDASWTAYYRQCCTAYSFCGWVLAAYIMGIKSDWNHDVLFDYQDRYMSITDGDVDPFGFTVNNEASGSRATDAFSEEMWDTYRSDYNGGSTVTFHPPGIWNESNNKYKYPAEAALITADALQNLAGTGPYMFNGSGVPIAKTEAELTSDGVANNNKQMYKCLGSTGEGAWQYVSKLSDSEDATVKDYASCL